MLKDGAIELSNEQKQDLLIRTSTLQDAGYGDMQLSTEFSRSHILEQDLESIASQFRQGAEQDF